MWELYDRLIAEIPEDQKVEEACVGRAWTWVQTAGQIGVAMTTQGETRPAISSAKLTGMSLKEAAMTVKSWNLIEAGIGMAAINAYYNTLQRRELLSAGKDSRKFFSAGPHIKGKTLGMIGHLRMSQEILGSAGQVYIMERNPHPGDYPDSACEYILPKCDVVIITGSALINKTMPRLLALSRNATTLLVGPTVPMAPGLLDFGVQCLSGLIVTRREDLRFLSMRGEAQSLYSCGEYFYLAPNEK